MKKVVIDSRLSGWKNAGIGRYIQMLLEHLDKLKIKSEKLKIVSINPQIKYYTLAEQILMPRILNKEKPDLVHFPHFNVPLFYNRPFVVTIHDLLWHEQIGFGATTQSKWKYLIKYLGYRLVMRHAVTKAEVIIVPSNWVKKQVIRRFPKVENKVKMIYEGVEKIYSDSDCHGAKRLAMTGDLVPNKYLIFTGSLYPHKNLKIVLDALSEFPDLKLVIASARSVFRERFENEIEKRSLKKQIVLAGFIPDAELVRLYHSALAFVFPSKSEGFGLPGLEAMASGCPVLSSNAGSLPEIYGKAAEYFDPGDKDKLIEKIRDIRDNPEYREKLIELGRKRVKLFSWAKCAEETTKVYENFLGLRSDK